MHVLTTIVYIFSVIFLSLTFNMVWIEFIISYHNFIVYHIKNVSTVGEKNNKSVHLWMIKYCIQLNNLNNWPVMVWIKNCLDNKYTNIDSVSRWCQHYLWKAAKFRILLITCGLWGRRRGFTVSYLLWHESYSWDYHL